MIKKILALVLVLGLCIGFSGCERYSDYKEPENRLFVSALGIDHTQNKINIFAEGSVSNSTADGEITKLLTGTGETVPEAFNSLNDKTPLTVDLSHCTVIALGKRQNDTEKNLLEYLLSSPEDMLGVYIIACENAKKLLSCKGETSVGIRLLQGLKNNPYSGGVRIPCTLLDIMNTAPNATLPYFSVENGIFVYDGAVYYRGIERICKKDADSARIINLLSGNFAKGKITVDNKTFNFISASTTKTKTDEGYEICTKVKLEQEVDISPLILEMQEIIAQFQNEYHSNAFNLQKDGKPLKNDQFENCKITLNAEVI